MNLSRIYKVSVAIAALSGLVVAMAAPAGAEGNRGLSRTAVDSSVGDTNIGRKTRRAAALWMRPVCLPATTTRT